MNSLQEFDPATGIIVDKTPPPTSAQSFGAVAWNDTLIYMLGGQNSNYLNLVQIYDPTTDLWTTGTPLPISNSEFACGIFENNIYFAGGFNGSYVSDTWVGTIDSGNPANITYTQLPDIPIGVSGQPGRSKGKGACDSHSRFYVMNGDDHGYTVLDHYYYDPSDGYWYMTPDNPPLSWDRIQTAVYVPTLDNGTLFCTAGQHVGGLVDLHSYGIAEIPGKIDLNTVGFAAMTNPVKGIADIVFTITAQSQVTLKVFDRTGRLVEQLVDRPLPAGVCSVSWNTANVPNGVYFLTLNADGQSDTHKMVVVR